MAARRRRRGGGGPSVGVYKSGTSAPTLTAVTYGIGAGGTGGTSPVNSGANGISRDVYP